MKLGVLTTPSVYLRIIAAGAFGRKCLHRVANLKEFEKGTKLRLAKQGEFGIHIRNIYQTKEDPNTCFIVADIDDMERAQGFIKQIKDSGLQEKAGVLTSETTFCTDVTYHLDIQDIWQMNIE